MTDATAFWRRRRALILAAVIASVAALVGGEQWRRSRQDTGPVVAARRGAAPTLVGPVKPSRLAEQLCAALHVLPGQRTAECCESPPHQHLYEECVDVVSRSLASGAIELDAAAVTRCERAMAEQLSGCDWVRPGLPLAPQACQRLLTGRVESRGACRSSLECADNLHCVVAAGASQGRCSPPESLGASCGRSTDSLAAYVLERSTEVAHPWCADFCSLVTHQCEPTPPEGAACRANINCAAGQQCSKGACRSGLAAQELASTGQACRTDLDCARGGCVPSGASATGVCGKRCSARLP